MNAPIPLVLVGEKLSKTLRYTRDDDGIRRKMLCLNMNFALKNPVFADQDILLQRRVIGRTRHAWHTCPHA